MRCVFRSMWSTTGQGIGAANPPTAKPFPLPYADDFETVQGGHTPKYLVDQDGAFEVRDCNGRASLCLEQVISEIPIPWCPSPDPFTIPGGESWTDYRVIADVRFLSQAPAVVMGRIDSSDVFKDDKLRLPSGYGLRIKPDGGWELFSAEYKKPTVAIAIGSARGICVWGAEGCSSRLRKGYGQELLSGWQGCFSRNRESPPSAPAKSVRDRNPPYRHTRINSMPADIRASASFSSSWSSVITV